MLTVLLSPQILMSVIEQRMNVTQMLLAATLKAVISVTVWKASQEMDSIALVCTLLLHSILVISLVLIGLGCRKTRPTPRN